MRPKTKVPTKILKLAREINRAAIDATEFNRTDNSALADWVRTFGYGEGDIEFNRLSDEIETKVKALQKLTGNKFRKTLAELCDLELTDHRTTDDEVFSASIGECEEQMDDKLVKRVKALKPHELALLRSTVTECCIGRSCIDCIYVSLDGERWVMRIRESDLDNRLMRLGWVEQAKAEVPNVLLSETPEVRRQAFRLIMGGAA